MENAFKIRPISPADYGSIIAVLDKWWGGRQMSAMLPKLFFTHFYDTSFVAELNGKMVGFLVGFLSQSNPDEAYIHFVGIHPDFRKQGVGSILYRQFFRLFKPSIASASNVSPLCSIKVRSLIIYGWDLRPNQVIYRKMACPIIWIMMGQESIVYYLSSISKRVPQRNNKSIANVRIEIGIK
jgi:GNAT superfamily N-acetyltransferase